MTGRTVLAVALLVVVAVVVLAAMARSWRAKQERSSAELPALPTAPAATGAARTGALEAVYVSTTVAGEPLLRVPGHGLGVRAPARVQVHDAGVTIERRGAPDVFVPAGDVVGVERAAGMAGKVVGGDRLVVVRWRLAGGPVLDTGLHVRHPDDREALTAALRALAGGAADRPADDTQTTGTDTPGTEHEETA